MWIELASGETAEPDRPPDAQASIAGELVSTLGSVCCPTTIEVSQDGEALPR